MKLGKIFAGLLFSAAIMTVSSCEEVLQNMEKVPTFYIPEIMYNGQTFQITRLSTCRYQFTTDSEYLDITETSDGKFIATAVGKWDYWTLMTLPVRVTAVNPDEPSIEPQVQDIYLVDWALKVYEGENEVSDSELKTGRTYKLKMVERKSGRVVDKIYGGMTDKVNPQALVWKYSADQVKEISSTATTFEFTPIATGMYAITADLGLFRTPALLVVK